MLPRTASNNKTTTRKLKQSIPLATHVSRFNDQPVDDTQGTLIKSRFETLAELCTKPYACALTLHLHSQTDLNRNGNYPRSNPAWFCNTHHDVRKELVGQDERRASEKTRASRLENHVVNREGVSIWNSQIGDHKELVSVLQVCHDSGFVKSISSCRSPAESGGRSAWKRGCEYDRNVRKSSSTSEPSRNCSVSSASELVQRNWSLSPPVFCLRSATVGSESEWKEWRRCHRDY